MREVLAQDLEKEDSAVMKTLIAEIQEICVYVAWAIALLIDASQRRLKAWNLRKRSHSSQIEAGQV